jgi:hypothetical protein
VNTGSQADAQWFDTQSANLRKITGRQDLPQIFPEYDQFSSYFAVLQSLFSTNVTYFKWKVMWSGIHFLADTN